MELEALKRQLAYLDDAGVNINKVVTDRHTQVSSYMHMMFGIWQKVFNITV
jgi:hypothetical protein